MDPQAYGAIGTVAGATIGAIAVIYGPEIRDRLPGATKGGTELGDWNCEWIVENPAANSPNKIEDTVNIKRCRRGQIIATGQNQIAGTFELTGRYTEFGIAFYYYHPGKNRDLVGVVQLKKHPGSILEGHWSQIVSTGNLIRGTTKWMKA